MRLHDHPVGGCDGCPVARASGNAWLMPNANDLAKFFERCIWPRALTQAERTAAFEALYVRQHDAHSYVCRRNEIADSWVGVMEGFLRVQDTTPDGNLIMFTGVAAGGWIGEGSLLKPEQRKYEIVATRPTTTVTCGGHRLDAPYGFPIIASPKRPRISEDEAPQLQHASRGRNGSRAHRAGGQR